MRSSRGDPNAVVVIESALIFEAEAWGTVPDWRKRFDRIILVTAPDDLKIRALPRAHPARVRTAEERAAAERDARQRLAAQLPDSIKIPQADFVIDNSGSLDATRAQAERVAAALADEKPEPERARCERMSIQCREGRVFCPPWDRRCGSR